jgi:hypothetical protein
MSHWHLALICSFICELLAQRLVVVPSGKQTLELRDGAEGMLFALYIKLHELSFIMHICLCTKKFLWVKETHAISALLFHSMPWYQMPRVHFPQQELTALCAPRSLCPSLWWPSVTGNLDHFHLRKCNHTDPQLWLPVSNEWNYLYSTGISDCDLD